MVSVALLLVYAGQFGLGRWEVDEFRYFTAQREYGIDAVLNRLYDSPRPFSEALIGLYGWSVLQFQRPLVSAALALLWSGVVIGSILAARVGLNRSPGRLATAVGLGIAPMVFCLQTNRPTEMFYWPVAAAAYLPMLAAAGALPFLLAGALTRQRKLWCFVALMVCVLSQEIGAALAIGYAMAATLRAVMLRRDTVRASLARELWWIVPVIAGFAVMAGLVLFRSQRVDLGADTKPYHDRLLASIGATLRQLPLDIATVGNADGGWRAAGVGLARKVVFAVGFALVWLRSGRVPPNSWLAVFVSGLGVGVFFSLLAAYYHYGDLCCERQATARGWLIELAFVATAVTALARWPVRQAAAPARLAGWLGPVLLTASLLPTATQIGAIRVDYGLLSLAERAKVRTWASGLATGSRQMLFVMPPDTDAMLIHGTSQPIGTYDLAKGAPDIIAAAGEFFGKAIVTTCFAWQGEKSVLIDGRRFIPACPPHDGPPDIIWNPGQE